MNSFLRSIVLLSAGLLSGCGESSASQDSSPETTDAPDTTPAGVAAETHIHDLACGCALEEVGHCGNYILVDGKYLELIGETGLGSMPFCGKEGLKGEVAGELLEGKYVATSFQYADL